MRVMVIVKADKQSEAGEMPGEDVIVRMRAFNEELAKAGGWWGWAACSPAPRGNG